MSSLSIRHMNFTLQARDQIRWKQEADEYRRGDIFEQMISAMKFKNTMKRNEIKWAQTNKKNACVFCKVAFKIHRGELDIFEQLTVLASIQDQT